MFFDIHTCECVPINLHINFHMAKPFIKQLEAEAWKIITTKLKAQTIKTLVRPQWIADFICLELRMESYRKHAKLIEHDLARIMEKTNSHIGNDRPKVLETS